MLSLLARVYYKLRVGALIVALIIAIVVWIRVYIQYRKLVEPTKIDWLIKRIRERAEDRGHDSDGDTEELSTMVDMGNLRLLDVNDL
ncbi:vpu protein [Human immunodeficiency virus 1]|uniref:Protein Vpu n=1 Tax=Human immunodeficiency virus type 1 TaxID=11676 RepID=Q994C6_HV1|nr:vpu protein [Human immunodeficiency virus 1]